MSKKIKHKFALKEHVRLNNNPLNGFLAGTTGYIQSIGEEDGKSVYRISNYPDPKQSGVFKATDETIEKIDL